MNDEPIMGVLFQIKPGVPSSSIMLQFLSYPEIDRERAMQSALVAMQQPEWSGPKQALFMRRDGFVEVLNQADLISMRQTKHNP